MKYEKHLKSLRDKLARGNMSVLVGSGFSKNVHPSFPTWDELLHDLTFDLYRDEIEQTFRQYTRYNTKPAVTKTSFIKEKCSEIISRIGYLELVSEFIRRKGYPESIATYIEERTPSITSSANGFHIHFGKSQFSISSKQLSLHRKLIQLPWNNIYTTNYDQLLDCCVDESQSDRLRSEIRELEEENILLYKNRDKVDGDLADLPEYEFETQNLDFEHPVDRTIIWDEEKELKNIETKVFLEREKKRIEDQLRENEQTVKQKETALLSRYNVVREASDLRLKRTKNIIKLHGSLRNANQRAKFEFKFDGDPHKQYVISKEDYDTYRDKHEAFTQLMRIALLQESFCLIGFSGVDPNFKAWINWVKDILHKAAIASNNTGQYKIYLIDVNVKELSADQELFFENHSIVRIPLLATEVCKFLYHELGDRMQITDISTAFNAFFTFLVNDEDIQPEIFQLDLSDEVKKRKIWNGFKISEIQKDPEVESMEIGLKQLEAIDGKIWISNPNYGHSINQHSLLNFINHDPWKRFLAERDDKQILKRLVILALKEYNVPIHNILEEAELKILESVPGLSQILNSLFSRNASLSINNNQPFCIYDRILQLAYSFRFIELRSLLDEWKAEGREKIQKAGFLSFFDSKKASQFLQGVLEDEVDFSDEEKLYGHELLHYITSAYQRPVNNRITRIIRNYEKAGYQPLYEKFKYLEKEVLDKPEKPAPLGEGRYSISQSIIFDKHSKLESSVRYLMILAESGFQLKINHTNWRTIENWFNIHAAGFELYPYAFLFYSLQYSDEKFLKRIGQDYAFSNNEKLKKELPNIAISLFRSYYDAPPEYRKHILLFLSTVIIAINPEVWQLHFLGIWKHQLKEKMAFEDPRRYTYLNFFVNAIQFITDKGILMEFVQDCLNQSITGETSQSISYLYYLNRNLYYKSLNQSSLSEKQIRTVNSVIKLLKKQNEYAIFILGNIDGLLGDSQRRQIKKALSVFDYNSVTNPRSWHIFLHFIEKDISIKLKIKSAILNSQGVWYTGIEENVRHVGINKLIDLSRLTYSEYYKWGVTWDKDDVVSFYKKLIIALSKIDSWINRRGNNFTFTDLLYEMHWFLEIFKKYLLDQQDIEHVIEHVSRLFKSDRNYEMIEQGLTSNDHSTVVFALEELSKSVYSDIKNYEAIQIILHKVLLQCGPALEASIGYLANWSKIVLSWRSNYSICKLYIEILIRFRVHPLKTVDQAVTEEKLVTIAYYLKLNGYLNEDVVWWLELGRNSVYNNVKQFFLLQDSIVK